MLSVVKILWLWIRSRIINSAFIFSYYRRAVQNYVTTAEHRFVELHWDKYLGMLKWKFGPESNPSYIN